jgi:hypothetical protein
MSSDKADLLSLDELDRVRSFILSKITIFRNENLCFKYKEGGEERSARKCRVTPGLQMFDRPFIDGNR